MAPTEEQDLNLQGVVHDLRNVFQTILDAAELMAADPKWSVVAGAVQRSAEHGQRLVGGLVERQPAPMTFHAIAQSAIQFASDLLEATHAPPVDFQILCSSAHLTVPGNPVEWERILVNLLLNSAQAVRSGGKVSISASRDAQGLHITVLDNGPGIAPAIITRVFEPHFSTKPANSGLGLHIVRSLVERNGGHVTVSNRAEGGAEFAITLHG